MHDMRTADVVHSSLSTDRPKVGVAVLLIRDRAVLLGKRKNSHGHGQWAPPGGHLEYGESFATCAQREVLEETGVRIYQVEFVAVTNDVFWEEQKHYITIFMRADVQEGNPLVLEPDKCEKWDWFLWDALPEPLFLPVRHFLAHNFDEALHR